MERWRLRCQDNRALRFVARCPCIRPSHVFDPKRVDLDLEHEIPEQEYVAYEYLIASYDGELRGIIEDAFEQRQRPLQRRDLSHCCGFEGSVLLATVPLVNVQHRGAAS